MPRLDALIGHLPSLYRPLPEETQPDGSGLLPAVLAAAAGALEAAGEAVGEVLPTRWLDHADSARFDPFTHRPRGLAGLGTIDLNDPDDALAVLTHPHIRHLARLAALLGLPPRREPALLRESVEAYRRRIRRIVALYRQGLGTVGAMRRMVEAQLPRDPALPPALADRPFWIEDFAPIVAVTASARTAGVPGSESEPLVGPLMRFRTANDALATSPPTVYITGVTPQENVLDPTEQPMLELLSAGDAGAPDGPPLAIGFRGTVAPDRTLRLRPVFRSWLLGEDGLLRADSAPEGDPAAPGPWTVDDDAPAGTPRALVQTHDRALWLAIDVTAPDDSVSGEVWRLAGVTWTRVIDGLPPVTALAESGDALVVATGDGVRRVALYPEDGFTAEAVAALDGQSVQALTVGSQGDLWLGTATGLARLPSGAAPDAAAEAVGLGVDGRFETAVSGVVEEASGRLLVATDLGIFRFDPVSDTWFRYRGGEPGDRALDWQPFDPTAADDAAGFPTDDDVFLPPVRALHRTADGALWLGTERGLARYVAVDTAGETAGDLSTTRLEAFPELGTGAVHALYGDPRGRLWIATDRGLVRHDGRDVAQHQAGAWQRLGHLDAPAADEPGPGDRGSWRFDRASAVWQRFEGDDWVDQDPAVLTTDEPSVTAVAWTDRATADLGTFDPATGAFTAEEPVADADLVMRVKPSALRIIDGGVPALPRVPVGTATWRYLALEPPIVLTPDEADLPAWTREGRLLPPPEDASTPVPARFDATPPPPIPSFEDSVFAFCPAARVRLVWRPRRPFAAIVHLDRRTPEESIDPALLDRVWEGINQVRPAGVHVLLAIEDDLVRGQAP